MQPTHNNPPTLLSWHNRQRQHLVYLPLNSMTTAMRHIDTLIYAGWVIPADPEGLVLEHHAVAIHEGKIIAILPSDVATAEFSAHLTHRLMSHALIPGLINSHTHAAMNLLRGYADDMPLMQWLHEYIWPAEQRWVDAEFVRDGTRLAIAEMLQSGVTCFNDMYFFPDVIAEVVDEIGIRAGVGLILVDFPTVWAKNADEYLLKAESVYQNYQRHARMKMVLAPHAPYSVSDEPLRKLARFAEDHQLPVHMHVQETADEVRQALERTGERPLARLEKLGLLSNRFMAVHATQLTDLDIEYLLSYGAHVIHCPESNLKLASGFCPVQHLMDTGINVALGTDGAASNDDLDMLGEMHTAALLAKGVAQNAAAVPAARALTMATLNGAKALGLDEIIGSLTPGKAADITAIDMRSLSTQPIYNVLSQIVYAVGREQVTDVWVAGEHLLKASTLKSIDIHELNAKIHQWHGKIAATRHTGD